MHTNLTDSRANHIVLVGSGEATMAALWRLCAAGARVRWYADSADVGEEAVLAHALGGGHVELSFDDPLAAPLDGATAIVVSGDDRRRAGLAERARASGLMVRHVDEATLSGLSPGDLMRASRADAATAA